MKNIDNIEDVFLSFNQIFFDLTHIKIYLNTSGTQKNLKQIKEWHEMVAKEVSVLQEKGASINIIIGWANHTVKELEKHRAANTANRELYSSDIQDIATYLRSAEQFFELYSSIYLPLHEKQTLLENIAVAPHTNKEENKNSTFKL